MPFHNPFIKDGRIVFPEGASLVKHVERWATVRGGYVREAGAERDERGAAKGALGKIRWESGEMRVQRGKEERGDKTGQIGIGYEARMVGCP